jgi:hypothetical protein
MTHYDSDAITRFAHDTAAAGADEFHRHLAQCGDCGAEFRLAVELELALRDRETWLIAELPHRPVAPPRWLLEREAARERERADVEKKLASGVTSTRWRRIRRVRSHAPAESFSKVPCPRVTL